MTSPIRKCPTCGRPVAAPEPPAPERLPPAAVAGLDEFFPFCSSRCRTVDLGKWLRGEYVIPGDPPGTPAGGEAP